MDGRDALAFFAPRVLEGEPRDSRRRSLGDDLQALDHAGHDLVLDPRVQTFGVLAHHDQVHMLDGSDVRQFDRPEVRVEIERFAQAHVDGREPFADGRGDRALQGDLVPPDRFDEIVGQRAAVLSSSFTPAS